MRDMAGCWLVSTPTAAMTTSLVRSTTTGSFAADTPAPPDRRSWPLAKMVCPPGRGMDIHSTPADISCSANTKPHHRPRRFAPRNLLESRGVEHRFRAEPHRLVGAAPELVDRIGFDDGCAAPSRIVDRSLEQ